MSIERRIQRAEERTARLTAPNLDGLTWDLSRLTDGELETLRALAARAARPSEAFLWAEKFDHARFAAMYAASREPVDYGAIEAELRALRDGPCRHCGKRADEKSKV
jgi:hypothetical protein